MKTLTRRHFLQVSGVALLGSQLPLRWQPALSLPMDAVYGRALETLPVTRGGSVVATLWADSVVCILGADANRYRIAGGWVAREGIQPLSVLPDPLRQTPACPYWAEVCAPAASVRHYADAAAPLVTRIGNGGVMEVVRALQDSDGAWLALDDGRGELLGWTQAAHWQPVVFPQPQARESRLEIDLARRQLTAFEDETPILQAPVATGTPALVPGSYITGGRRPGGKGEAALEAHPFYGAAWTTQIEGAGGISGVYWHNRFGTTAPGPAVQAAPAVAYWVYGWLKTGSSAVIV